MKTTRYQPCERYSRAESFVMTGSSYDPALLLDRAACAGELPRAVAEPLGARHLAPGADPEPGLAPETALELPLSGAVLRFARPG